MIWQYLAFLFFGVAVGTFLSALMFIKHIPPGTEISVGKFKMKGRGHDIENLIKTGDIIPETKKEARQKKRQLRREKK